MGLFSIFKSKSRKVDKLMPESKWIVEIQSNTIRTIDYKGVEESIDINNILQITIETNDTGPWGTDLWWKIETKGESLFIPNGATGEQEMLKYFQSLPNFDNDNLINAMRTTENAEFVVWKRE